MQERYLVKKHNRVMSTPSVAPDIIDLETATTTPAEQLEDMEKGLGGLQRFFLKRHMGRLHMEEAKKIAAAIGQAVVESTVYKLTLALDFDKKKTFLAYIQGSSGLQRELHADGRDP